MTQTIMKRAAIGAIALLSMTGLSAQGEVKPAAPVQAREVLALKYDLSAAGMGAAEIYVTVTLAGADYHINAQGASYGAADLFESLKLNATTQGAVASAHIAPNVFATDNISNGRQRWTRVAWRGPEAIVQDVQPTLAAEKRTPIPEDAREGALDPISAMYSFALGGPARNVCEGEAKVFDGRRSYRLVLDAENGGGVFNALQIGGVEATALKCRVTSIRTGGKSPDGWLSSSSDYEHATIWFWRDAHGRAVPVRLEADAPIGYAVAQLSRLP